MNGDLHARIVVALDEEQARAEAATPAPWSASEEEVQDLHFGPVQATVLHGPDIYSLGLADGRHIAAQDPARTLARVAADRRVLERHWNQHAVCNWCGDEIPMSWPCPDVLDLAARYGIEVEP